MAQTYGLTAAGFIVKQQNDIITEINALLQGIFGPNANLSAESVLGQLVGVFSEREALLWQLLEAIYDSEYPAGAEGTSVDNILAWNNLRRLGATPTTTAPTSTSGQPGLVCYGTPGTIIPAGSIISVQGNASLQFETDAPIPISAAVNAVQLLSTYGGAPTSGEFTLSIIDPAGNPLTTESIPYDAEDTTSQIEFSAMPSGSSNLALTLTLATTVLTTQNIPCESNYPTAAAIQSAIAALSGYSAVAVTGSDGAYTITWGAIPQPALSVATQPTGTTVSVIDSIQASINTLYDSVALTYPYTDVSVSGTFSAAPGGFTITFGANSPATGEQSSGYQAQATFQVASNNLNSGSIGLNCVTTKAGSLAQGIGSATCTADGPNFVAADYLNVIGSSVSGWSSVNNPLDCIVGSNLETDTEALTRRATLLAENANGPLQSIVEKVSQVSGVVQAVGYENTSLAAQQIISLSATAASGSFVLSLTNLLGTVTTGNIAWNALAAAQVVTFSANPTGGTWGLTLGSQTYTFDYNAVASTIQSAIAVGGYSNCIVTGNYTDGFVIGNGLNPLSALSVDSSGLTGATAMAIDSIQSAINQLSGYGQAIVTGSIGGGAFTVAFNGSNGGQPQALFAPTSSLEDSESNPITLTAVYGLPGKAFQILVNDNNGEASDSDIAEAIFGAKPGGIMTYGATSSTVQDAFGNSYAINFGRPAQIQIYVVVNLQTDLTTTPNPQFQLSSIATIQQDIVEIGSAFGVGGTIIGYGTNGLIGAFNSVPGILGYSLYFGTAASPTKDDNIPLLSTQTPQFETYLVQVFAQ